MPLVAPVITAILPSSRPMSLPPISVDANIPASCRQGKRACSIAIPRGPGRFATGGAPKSSNFGMVGHILDSLIT
jgi:hypothetical protein